MPMSESQEAHLKKLHAITFTLMSEKYRKGQAEHGGNLFDMSLTQLLDEALGEAIDQVTYLVTAIEKLKNFKKNHESNT